MTNYYFDPILRQSIERILLPDIQQPGQYIGGELFARVKPAESVAGRLCLAFSDAYTIGMSNFALTLLYAIMNDRPDWSCQRAFTPFPDMEAKLRENRLPLYALETFQPLWSFDVIGFSLQHELCATNLLTMLDLGGIAIRRQERTADDPLIIAGGQAAFNPEPLSPFIDLFVVGDGEEALGEICDFWLAEKKRCGLPSVLSSEGGRKPTEGDRFYTQLPIDVSRSTRREMLLNAARKFSYAYVPEFYDVKIGPDSRAQRPRPTQAGVPEFITPAAVKNLDDFPLPTEPILPLIEAVQDRISLEIMRGCPQKCRFCQSSAIKRPLRFRSVESIVEAARSACCKTGIDEVTLLSLSSSEYPQFDKLIAALAERLTPDGVTVSVPSLRVNHQLSRVVTELSTERSGALTLAPEAARESMRRRIAKKVTDDDLMRGCRSAFENGFYRIKMYFMCGFPEENEADIDGIIELCSKIAYLGKEVRGRWPTVVANVSNFVPKPQTPLQWAAMATEERFTAIHRRLREARRPKAVELKYHYLPGSLLEGLLTRGDRRVGDIIESAWRRGARFCDWKDRFRPDLWREALAESSLDTAAIVHTEYDESAELPWDHITIWAGKEKLLKEYRLAAAEKSE